MFPPHSGCMPIADASMAPAFAYAGELAKIRATTEYWARKPPDKVFGG